MARIANSIGSLRFLVAYFLLQCHLYYCEYWMAFHLSPDLASRDQTGHIRNRTAVMITGQLRSGNVSFSSGLIQDDFQSQNFGADDPPTVILTQIEWFLKPLAEHGGLDVFMFVDAHPEDANYEWNGNPATFRPRPGDTTACRPYSDHPLFHTTGSKFFCMVEAETQLMNGFIRNFSSWQRYAFHGERMYEQALRQYYDMYRANLAAKQYAVANNIKYTYKVRLRPDTAFVRPAPDFATIQFKLSNHPDCNSMVYYSQKRIRNGNNVNEDWFNFGLTADMDRVLDRYQDFTTELFHGLKPGRNFFNLESHMLQTMYSKYRICMQQHVDFWVVVIRLEGQSYNTWQPPPNAMDWTDMSSIDPQQPGQNATNNPNASASTKVKFLRG